jgi:hypothetical protein
VSLPGRLAPSLLLLPLLACCETAPGDDPHIDAFTASPTELRVGDPVDLLPRFTGGPGQVTSGRHYPVGPSAPGMLFTLIVGDGEREVRQELRLPLVYRHRLRSLTPSDNARVDHGAAGSSSPAGTSPEP